MSGKRGYIKSLDIGEGWQGRPFLSSVGQGDDINAVLVAPFECLGIMLSKSVSG